MPATTAPGHTTRRAGRASRTSGRTKNGWSDARRAKHAAAIRKWKPWQKSTGPKTDAGKARAAQNAFRHGGRSHALRVIRHALTLQSRYVARVEHHARLRRAGLIADPHLAERRLMADGWIAARALISACLPDKSGDNKISQTNYCRAELFNPSKDLREKA